MTYNWGAIEFALANRIGPRFRHLHLEDGFGLRRRVGSLPVESGRERLRCLFAAKSSCPRTPWSTWRRGCGAFTNAGSTALPTLSRS